MSGPANIWHLACCDTVNESRACLDHSFSYSRMELPITQIKVPNTEQRSALGSMHRDGAIMSSSGKITSPLTYSISSNGASARPLSEQGLFPALPNEKYQIVYADPPWDYKGQLQHAGPGSGDSGGAIRHYPTVTLNGLKQLPVSEIADEDCLLFLWSTSPHLDQAIELGKAWGFAWATVAFVWDKQRVNPGFYTMSQCELCLVFKRGRIPRPRGARNVRQLVTSPRRRHSAKPDEVRTRIEAMFPTQPKIELFAREQYNEWDSWPQQSFVDPFTVPEQDASWAFEFDNNIMFWREIDSWPHAEQHTNGR